MSHIIWDWNGTLWDDLDLVIRSVNALLVPMGMDPIDHDDYRRHYTRPLHRFYEVLLGRPIDDSVMRDIDDQFHDAYFAEYERAGLTADARTAIASIGEAGSSQSIQSMLWHDRLVTSVREVGLDDVMLAVDGHRGTAGETKAEHLGHHVEQLRALFPLNGARMVLIGDITDDAAAAAAVGIDCVLYDGGSQERSRLETASVPIAGSLVEAVQLAGI